MRYVRTVVFLCAACAGTMSVHAQQSVDVASVSGRVRDPSGAVVPGAQITATHTQTNLTSIVVSDQEGRFRLPYLRVGPYGITIGRQGFQPATRHLTLTAGAAFELPVTLTLGSVDASVTVTGDATVLEAARSPLAGTVSEPEVRTLPMNARHFLELALLVPGVAPANIASTQLFPETSAVPGISLSVGSQRNLSNSFIVDGLSANDDAAGLSGLTYGVDAVEQFQVITSAAQAELGRALGGYGNGLRVSRAFAWTPRLRLEALIEGFNLTNHLNVLTRNTNFGPGPYPTNPSPTFNQITATGEPRSFQLGARLRF